MPADGETAVKRVGLAATVGLWWLGTGAARAAEPGAHAAHAAGDIAWMLAASGLALLRVPGLALYFGGMVRRKNILGTMMQTMVAPAVVGVPWLLAGYSLAFGESASGALGWSPSYFGLGESVAGRTVPGSAC